MSTTAKIATAEPGSCDACEQQFAEREVVHEFVFASRGGSFVSQYATCARCHQSRAEGATSAPPVRVLVHGQAKAHKAAFRINSTTVRCTPDMGEFFSRSAIEARFQEGVAA